MSPSSQSPGRWRATLWLAGLLSKVRSSHHQQIVGLASAVVLLVLCSAGSALANRANKGLRPGVAIPSWAAHRRVHFFPGVASVSGLKGGLSEQSIKTEAHNGLEQRENTDRPLLYREGKGVQHSPHVYVIFWGSAWNEATGSALRTQLLKMYEGLSGSSYQGILTQYFDQTGRVSSTVTVSSYTDTGVTTPSSVNDNRIQKEVTSAIKANGWTGDFDAQFVVVPAPGSTYEAGFGERFCGYHGMTAEGEWSYTFYPYIGDEPFYEGCISYARSSAADVTSMVAAHEYAESATDPTLDTWFTEQGLEIADICAKYAVEASEGSLAGSWVAGLWDDDQSACSQSDPSPPYLYAITEPGVSREPHEIELVSVVNPEGSETRYRFEYDTSEYTPNGPPHGTSVPVPDANAGSAIANQHVSETVKGVPEGIYHYRLVATNGTGNVYGEDRIAVSAGFAAQTLPLPTDGYEERQAYGVSCVASQLCIAVGAYPSSNLEALATLAEVWNGSIWSAMLTPNPPGMTENELLRVSCTSASACMAVGYDRNASGVKLTLAERWDGTAWSVLSTPNPSGALDSRLWSVSCTSPSACTAVGFYTDLPPTEKASAEHWKTLAERWDGSKWSLLSTPDPSGASDSFLTSVSCTSASACTSVGHSEDSAETEKTLAERWDGAAWTIQPTIDPDGNEPSNRLSGVSCTSSSTCTAVGTHWYRVGSAFVSTTLAERWNGNEWSVQSTPDPSPSEGSVLSGVSCTSSSACTAVGYYSNLAAPRTGTEALGERWNGTTWSILGVPPLPETPETWHERWLSAVSCTEPAVCMAVGDSLNAPFGGLAPQVAFAAREFVVPIATTEAAFGVTSSEATLSGTVNPEGLETHYRFEYGPTMSYGSTVPVPEGSAGSAVSDVKVSQLIAGLRPNATYHYRLVASSAAGTTYGEDRMFTTAAPPPPSSISPPTISGSAVQGQTLTEAHSSWSNNPTSYAYQWEDCDGSGANCSAIARATGQTYTLTVTDIGDTVRVQETASNAGGTGGAASSAATALVQSASLGGGVSSGSGGGSGSSSGGLGGVPGGQGGGEAASLASVSGVSTSGDLVLVSLSCHGSASASCTVTLTLTVVEQLRRGRLFAVSAATGRHRLIVIVGRATITLSGGERKLARVVLNATGRRLLMSRHALAVKLTFSGNGVRLFSRIVNFKVPARTARRRR